MTPVLFDKYSTRSIVGVLDDCISCSVTEEVNGVYTCEFQYPMTGPYFEQLINYGGIIYAAHAHGPNGYIADYFDIYKYSAPLNGIVTFFAQHVSYRLSNLVVSGGWTGTDPEDVLSKIATHAETANEFTFTLDGDTYDAGTLDVKGYKNARSLLLGREDTSKSCVQTWDCEFVFNGFDVQVYKKRGYDKGVQIRYGKNLSNIQREKDSGGIISAVFPYWHDSDDANYTTAGVVYSSSAEAGLSPWTTLGIDAGPPPTQYDIQIKAGNNNLFFRPAIINASAVDFSDQFENQPTAAQLQQAAREYMSKNSTWRAVDNISIEFIDLFNTPEYNDIRDLEDCNVGDYVSIYYPELGVVSEGVEIVSATYDAIGERYTSMQLGTIRTTLAQAIIDYIGGQYK